MKAEKSTRIVIIGGGAGWWDALRAPANKRAGRLICANGNSYSALIHSNSHMLKQKNVYFRPKRQFIVIEKDIINNS